MRPTIQRVRRYKWLSNGSETPGIGLLGEHGILAHMTATEALQVATDIADTLEQINSNTTNRNNQ